MKLDFRMEIGPIQIEMRNADSVSNLKPTKSRRLRVQLEGELNINHTLLFKSDFVIIKRTSRGARMSAIPIQKCVIS